MSLTEIEWMLMMLRRNHGSRAVTSAFPNLPEGPRVGGVCSTYEECRAAFTCSYCGSHNLLQCSEYHCSVRNRERLISARRGRSEGT